MRAYRSLSVVLTLAATVGSAVAQQSSQGAVKALVQQFFAAEKAYDASTLATLVDADYVEVSPAGEVDTHDRFLGFYAPDKKVDWPAMTVNEEQVRTFGDTAVDTLRITYAMPDGSGSTHTMSVRGTFVARREGSGWKLISAQYTGIRSVPVAPANK